MELKAHFSNIHNVIIDHLEHAQSEIVAAIAWFTDRDIFEVLCKKSRSITTVSIALIGDDINKGPGGLNFQRLINCGGRIIFLPPGSRDAPTMHHKFCVIDSSIVITGSYNWSHKARTNDENITVVTGATDFASKYLETFNRLLDRVGESTPSAVDYDAVRRRLEMIRNLILLDEQEDVATHVSKLRPIAHSLKLSQIIVALDQREYRAALEAIDGYLHRATAIVDVGLIDVAQLRFQLEILELRLESLSDDKSELERCVIIFNRRHSDALGDLIQEVLKARAELAWLLTKGLKADQTPAEVQTAARNAEETYKNYSRAHEELQHSEPLLKLDLEAERDLKALYRKACHLCHPDKAPKSQSETAHRVFVELQQAYKANDLVSVRAIYEALKAGGVPDTRSATLSEPEALRAAIAELEQGILKLVAELKSMQESAGVKMMVTAGATESDWQSFFGHQREAMEKELAKIVAMSLTNLEES